VRWISTVSPASRAKSFWPFWIPRCRAHPRRRSMRGHFRRGCIWFCSCIGSRDWSPACISGCARRGRGSFAARLSQHSDWEILRDLDPTVPLRRLGTGRPARFCADLVLPAGHCRRWRVQPRHAGAVRAGLAGTRRVGLARVVLGGGNDRPGAVLAAEAAGVRGTGIGCYFDDVLHRALGLTGHDWQSLYHFTIGESRRGSAAADHAAVCSSAD
jgi:hypothetical protein